LEDKYDVNIFVKDIVQWLIYNKNNILQMFNSSFETSYTIKEINIIIPLLFDSLGNKTYKIKDDIYMKYG
jgi:hypothetical protein